MAPPGPLEADWLAFSRRAAEAGRAALRRFPKTAQRAERLGRGEGGDMTLAIDAAVEDAVFAELDALGMGLCVVSEERGLVAVAGGGPVRVVIDPIDGSLNAKRRLPLYSLSIAVADGLDMESVAFGYVCDFAAGEEWWASRGGGAWLDGERLGPLGDPDARLEILGVESAHPRLVAAAAGAIASAEPHRLRMIGSLALSLCYVASARFDGLLSLRGARSVDVAAGQLIVREAGGAVSFPDAVSGAGGVSGGGTGGGGAGGAASTAGGGNGLGAGLDLDMRSRVVAAASESLLDELVAVGEKLEA